jgi:hypothetical protein
MLTRLVRKLILRFGDSQGSMDYKVRERKFRAALCSGCKRARYRGHKRARSLFWRHGPNIEGEAINVVQGPTRADVWSWPTSVRRDAPCSPESRTGRAFGRHPTRRDRGAVHDGALLRSACKFRLSNALAETATNAIRILFDPKSSQRATRTRHGYDGRRPRIAFPGAV